MYIPNMKLILVLVLRIMVAVTRYPERIQTTWTKIGMLYENVPGLYANVKMNHSSNASLSTIVGIS